MNALRTSKKYENALEVYIEFSKMNAPSKNRNYFCPYVKCLNESQQDLDDYKRLLTW